MSPAAFRYDFAGFVLGAALCALPPCAVIQFVTLAEARALQPESTRALDMPRMSGEARAVPPSGGDLRLHTEGKAHQKRAGLTGENRSPLRSAQHRLEPRDRNDLPESRVAERRESDISPSDGGAQGVRSVLPGLSQPVSFAERAPGGHLRQMATDAANLCGVPVALFHALIERESSWRPHVVSSAGAVGLAQVKPSTGRGVSPTLDVRDPWQNLVAGACYLRQQFDRFGTWRAALHAYRMGPNARPSKVARDYAADIIQGSAQ